MPPSLLGLPTELLDAIASHLDQKHANTIYFNKEGLSNLSKVCRHLRGVVLPLLFRDMTLNLAFTGEVLTKPSLLSIMQRDGLAQHIRSVRIKQDMTRARHFRADIEDAFVPSASTNQWYTSVTTDLDHPQRLGALAQRVTTWHQAQARAQSALHRNEEHFLSDDLSLSTPEMVNEHGAPEILAACIVMQCIPPTTRKITFEGRAFNWLQPPWTKFPLQVLAFAMEVLGPRLQDLCLMTDNGSDLAVDLARYLSDTILSVIEPKRFTFVEQTSNITASRKPPRKIPTQWGWNLFAPHVRELNLHDLHANARELIEFVQGFPALRRLNLCRFHLALPRVQPGTALRGEDEKQMRILAMLIVLRRGCPDASFQLAGLRYATAEPLPAPAMEWLSTQAVPKGAHITYDREERLMEDFRSFLPLWKAEASADGIRAKQDWEGESLKLVDLAMSRRRLW